MTDDSPEQQMQMRFSTCFTINTTGNGPGPRARIVKKLMRSRRLAGSGAAGLLPRTRRNAQPVPSMWPRAGAPGGERAGGFVRGGQHCPMAVCSAEMTGRATSALAPATAVAARPRQSVAGAGLPEFIRSALAFRPVVKRI